jgi:uncharacterized protein (DUF488 family)
MAVHTVGHSNLPFDAFVANLRRHGVELLVDVRSVPRSRFAPWSTHPRVAERLAEVGVSYAYLGQALGGRPPSGGKPDYDLMAREPAYLAGIDDLLLLAAEKRVAVMCSEGDPTQCHREHLIGRSLRDRGLEVRHITRRGELAE